MLCPVFACGVRMSVAGPSPTPRALPAPPVLRLALHSPPPCPSAPAPLFAPAPLISRALFPRRAALRRGRVPGGGGGGGAGGGGRAASVGKGARLRGRRDLSSPVLGGGRRAGNARGSRGAHRRGSLQPGVPAAHAGVPVLSGPHPGRTERGERRHGPPANRKLARALRAPRSHNQLC